MTQNTSASRARVLFLCQNLPYPPDGGALIRSYHTVRLLEQHFDVDALYFFRRASRPTSESVAEGVRSLSRFGHAEAFPIPGERSRVRHVWDHVRSVATGRAYTRWTYDSAAMHQAVEETLRERRIDLVHLDSLDLVAYLPRCLGCPVVVAHHNVESQLLERRGRREGGLEGAYIIHQSRLTRREERRWCPRVSLNCVASREDKETLEAIAPGSRLMVVPNGVDTSEFVPSDREPGPHIVFVGGHTWFPNRDGMEYFTEEILPRILERRPGTQVTWVGRASDEVRAGFERRGVTMTGYVDDIRPHVYDAACFVVPLRVGGGTRLKILDAWALGKAVVSTSHGAEGLDLQPGRNILIADTPEAFAESVISVLDDGEVRKTLEAGGRSTAVATYDWSVIGRDLGEAYSALLEDPLVQSTR